MGHDHTLSIRARRAGNTRRQANGSIAILALVATAFGDIRLNAQQPAPPTPAPLVFDGVTVIDVEHGTRIPAQRVLVVGNRIRAVGPAGTVKVPAGAQLVDARGKYLIPGLWDLHLHPRGAAHTFYPLLLANGVTGIRDAGSEVPLDTLRLWRREILTGTRVGPPRQLLSGQSIAGPDAACQRSAMSNAAQSCVTDAADARHYVDSLKAAGADMIKPRAVDAPLYFAIAAEARRLGIPFGGHADLENAIDVSDSGASIVDHITPDLNKRCTGDSASVERCRPVAEHFKHNGTWLVPTLVRLSTLLPSGIYPAFDRFRIRAKEFWSGSLPRGNWLLDSTGAQATPRRSQPGGGPRAGGHLKIMRSVGLPILAGTDIGAPVLMDVPPGFGLHTELAMYVVEGLTPLEALQTATLNPARFLHATDSLGTVAPGKLADLVLLDADPLADITNTTTVRAVVANGRYFDRTALDQLLTEARATVTGKR